MEEIILKFIIDNLYNEWIYNYDINKTYEFNSYIEIRNWDKFDTIKPECISIVKKNKNNWDKVWRVCKLGF